MGRRYPVSTSSVLEIIDGGMTAQKNIFSGTRLRAQFVRIIYDELMKGDFVSYEDVMCKHKGRPHDYYKNYTISREGGYGELKKAFSEVVNKIKAEVGPDTLQDNGCKGKGKAYRYIGEDKNPLREERDAVIQKYMDDYIEFCRQSVDMLPRAWVMAYFKDSQFLVDAKRRKRLGLAHVSSGMEQVLTNIEMLPFFNDAINRRKVLRVSYSPFNKPQLELIFHPQYIKEYNCRWFVFGEADVSPFHAFNIALDRVSGMPSEVGNVEYIPAESGFYEKYFKDIVGVTHEKGMHVERVVIRTCSLYQHGLLLTKPIHHSQVESLPYGVYSGSKYGEFTLEVEPNRELISKILSFGDGVEIVSPNNVRDMIMRVLEEQIKRYSR